MKILKFMFPIFFNIGKKLTKEQKQEIDDLDKEIGLCGEFQIALEYEMKYGRDHLIDTLITSFFTSVFLILITMCFI